MFTSLFCSLEILGQNSIFLGQSVDAIVRLAHPPDGPANCVSGVVTSHPAGGLINFGEIDLDGGMVLGGNDTITGRAKSTKILLNKSGEFSDSLNRPHVACFLLFWDATLVLQRNFVFRTDRRTPHVKIMTTYCLGPDETIYFYKIIDSGRSTDTSVVAFIFT